MLITLEQKFVTKLLGNDYALHEMDRLVYSVC